MKHVNLSSPPSGIIEPVPPCTGGSLHFQTPVKSPCSSECTVLGWGEGVDAGSGLESRAGVSNTMGGDAGGPQSRI